MTLSRPVRDLDGAWVSKTTPISFVQTLSQGKGFDDLLYEIRLESGQRLLLLREDLQFDGDDPCTA